MQQLPITLLFCSFFITLLPAFGQAEDSLSWARQMILEAEKSMDREKTLAAIGEQNLESGLWITHQQAEFGGELLAFEGIPDEKGVELSWTTANEWNSKYFQVERQNTQGEFSIITLVKAAGNSSQLQRYQFFDRFAAGNLNTYRLVQVDQNGASHNSAPITVDNREDGFLALHPSSNEQQLAIETDIKMVRIKITDRKGNVWVKEEKDATSFARIDIDQLKPGAYEVLVEDGDQVRVMKFEKKKR